MSDDPCCVDVGDVTISIKRVNEDTWDDLPTPNSLQDSIDADAGTKKIRVEIPIEPDTKLTSASLPSSDNIDTYTVKLVKTDDSVTEFGPVSIYIKNEDVQIVN